MAVITQRMFYHTTTPDAVRTTSGGFLCEDFQDAAEKAAYLTASDHKVRYVVMIVGRVEPATPPVKITRIE